MWWMESFKIYTFIFKQIDCRTLNIVFSIIMIHYYFILLVYVCDLFTLWCIIKQEFGIYEQYLYLKIQ